MTYLNLDRRLVQIPAPLTPDEWRAIVDSREYERESADDTMGLRRILHNCEHDPDAQLTRWLDIAEQVTEPEQQAAEIADTNELLEPFVDGFSLPGYDYLGTRAMVSGGEVIELDSHLEARYEEQYDEGLPF